MNLEKESGLLKKLIKPKAFQSCVEGCFGLLESCISIFEKNGDYVLTKQKSGWCKYLHGSSKKLCKNCSKNEAIDGGKWLCHESTSAIAKIAMKRGKPYEAICAGGLKYRAVPIVAQKNVVGAISMAYGSPPKSFLTIEKIAKDFKVSVKKLVKLAEEYSPRSSEIIKIAKHQQKVMAEFLGFMIEFSLKKKKLRESESKFSTILNFATDGVVLADINTKMILYANPEMKKLTGYSIKEFEHLGVADIHPKESLSHVFKQFNLQARGKIILARDLPVLKKNKEVIYCDIKSRPISINDKEYLMGFFRDITERKQIEDELSSRLESEEVIAKISQKFSNILPNEINKEITNSLRTIAKYTGVDVCCVCLLNEEKSCLVHTHEWCAKGFKVTQKDMQKVLKNKIVLSGVKKNRVINLSKNEVKVPVWKNKTVIMVPLELEQKVIGALGIVSSEKEKILNKQKILFLKQVSSQALAPAIIRKHLYKKERLSKIALEESLKEKEILLQEVYHRVKNNMQIVASLLQLQLANIKDPRVKIAFEESKSRIMAMSIIHEKLYSSRTLSSVDMNEYVNELLQAFFGIYNLKNVKIKINIKNIHMPIEKVVPLGLIINELISNSVKHAFVAEIKNPQISIKLEKMDKNKFKLFVGDNGVGLPKKTRIKNSKTLGIALIKSLSDQINGKISFKNGRGLRAELWF